MKIFQKLILLFSLLVSLVSILKADVYLLTDTVGLEHSILVVTKKDAEGQETLITVLSKQPLWGKDSIDIIDGVILRKNGKPIFNIAQKTGYSYYLPISGDLQMAYNGMKLSITSGSELEEKVIKQINIYKKKPWLFNNCGQATFGVLRNAGYFDDTTIKTIQKIYGTTEFAESPVRTSQAVSLQEIMNAARKHEEAISETTQNILDGGMSYLPGESPAEQLFNPDKGEGADDQCRIPNEESGGSEVPASDDEVSSGDTSSGGDDDSKTADDSGNIMADGSGIGKVVDAALDKAAIVKPTISHKRILWLFSGESMWDSFKSAGKPLAENIKLSELRKNFSDMWGEVVGKNSSNMSDIESDIGSVKQYLDWTGE